ncbi:PREDICTED: MKRN2 opposite strand protein-like [Priapulus caudatus]|uniref:MKRN2 opposite strand protein-like n=1 Tax=Priapulus caudatus TaxID=37621 RepID=A0ABM1ES84_PRICU|nr:PREDICTED: MKRN2 opposite strand protein-like [Priapulus caudatus]XP_014675055.1 PREDICTED: MKRN2 opposite strand protein-like [Priapulus caudatus]
MNAPVSTEPIFCFEHCQKGRKIYALQIPGECPLCGVLLASSELILPPFRVPSPFSRSPHSLVIRPTIGSFLRDYKNARDLHIGITNSKGLVHDYNEKGVNFGSSSWEQCVSVPLQCRNARRWDAELRNFSAHGDWFPQNYSESDHNCLDFVVGFLRHAEATVRVSAPLCKEQLCAELILPRMTQAAKYVTLYRRVSAETAYVSAS